MNTRTHRGVLAERERCPTCNQPVGAWKPSRICAKCAKPIRKGHKWHIVKSKIRHRVCDDPDSYGADYFEMRKRDRG